MKKNRFGKIIALMLALMTVLLCTVPVAAEDAAAAADNATYQIAVSITDDKEGLSVSGRSGKYLSGNANLAAELVLLINEHYDELKIFNSPKMRQVLLDSLNAYAYSETYWISHVNGVFRNYEIEGQDLKTFAANPDTVLNDLMPGVRYSMSFYNDTSFDPKYGTTYTVTLTVYRNGENYPVTDPADNGVADLMITDHIAYVLGNDLGTFCPDDTLSRAEAAQIFYNLLKDKEPKEAPAVFEDVPENAWYAQAVNTISAYHIIEGDGEGHFLPEKNITRAEFVTMVARLVDRVESIVTFSDVAKDHWAYTFIAAAESYNWINSTKNEAFRPDDDITRAETVDLMNNVLGRMADKEAIDANVASLKSFPDVVKDECWAYYQIMEAANPHDYVYIAGSEQWK